MVSRTCGDTALDVFWQGETLYPADHAALRVLDVAATLNAAEKTISLYVVNRSETDAMETTISLETGVFAGPVRTFVVNDPDVGAENTFDHPGQVGVAEASVNASGKALTYTFEPHSVTALVCRLA